jgi:predicted TIM-barrel fold metal-dependent hydrolase
MTETQIRGFDADNHYYEALDAFTRYIEPQFAKRCMQWATIDGKTRLLVGGKINRYLANPTFDKVADPGCLEEYFRGYNPNSKQVTELFGELEPPRPAYRDRDARLAVLDEQHLDGALLFPTLGVGMEQALRDDLPAMTAAFRAFNQWVDDDWGFHYQERIFAAPYITLADPDNAAAQLHWALDHGARVVVMAAGPILTEAGWKPPAHPDFAPFWSLLNESRITLAYHAGDSAYTNLLPLWGESAQAEAHRIPLMRGLLSANPVPDTMAALLSGGIFQRYPNLRLAIIETGADWVAPLFKLLKKSYGQAAGAWPADPIETFRRHVWVAPYYENDLNEIKELVGIDRVLFGSDWPHTEGLSEPLDYLKDIEQAGLSDEDRDKVIRLNGASLVQPAAQVL